MPDEITIDTDDPAFKALLTADLSVLRTVIREIKHGSYTMIPTWVGEQIELLLRLAASSQPAEPPPGVYREDPEVIWKSSLRADGKQWWFHPGDPSVVYEWPELRKVIRCELVPLWSAAELIPDPDDERAVWNLAMDIAPADSPKDIERVAALCRVLRARAESRTGAPEASDG